MSREIIGKIIGRVRENMPQAKLRRELRAGWAVNRPIYEKAEEARKYILTISLQDYAANQGRSPSDYLMQQLSSYSSDYHEEWCVAKSTGDMLDKMERGGFEAVVNLQLNISRAYSFFRGSPPVNVTATGTALKLKEEREE